MRRALILLISSLTVACASRATSTPGVRPPVAPNTAAEGPSGAPGAPLAWADLGPATFARARSEKRLVLVDGSAEWCHWCHVMEATTYHDARVRRLMAARFVAVKVDVDSNPAFEERYRDWGWPATVLMTADGEELGVYKGYLPPERMGEILEQVIAQVDASAGAGADADAGAGAMTEQDIAARLDSYWDPAQGSWGRPQKVPLYQDNAWELARAAAGDAQARARALFALDRQRAIIDPVWGGICQYSTDGDWAHPHYEKLMPFQAGAIDNYAAAYALTHDPQWLTTAQRVRGFVDRFMTTPDGAFATTMDADLHAHEPGKPYLTGRAYYALDDAHRRALGIPRVDASEYARENGLAIAAYVTLYEASGDATALAAAERAAARILATHATGRGGVTHGPAADAPSGEVLYLADNAAFGFALARLYEATKDPSYLEAARRIARFVASDLADAKAGGFFGSTPDPGAVGVFAVRQKPVEDDAMAARFLARLGRLAATDEYRAPLAGTLAFIRTRDAVASRGRMIGDILLALTESD